MRTIAITGGLGFIGGNLVNYWMDKYPDDTIICMDMMTYAANPSYVNRERKQFINCYVDITKKEDVRRAMQVYRPDHVIHLAAESHVCRSIEGPEKFVNTNVIGTMNLLECFNELHPKSTNRFHHVSTDEVFGVASGDSKFTETTPYDPKSPYAASKAASDHLVRAYGHTYGMNVVITNCSNNFGPSQHLEKLIPKTIHSLLTKQPITIYGNGTQERDWIYVGEHCEAIDTVFHMGNNGDTYLVGGNLTLDNVSVVMRVIHVLEYMTGEEIQYQIKHTKDRPTDDQRYSIDCTKLAHLGWKPRPDKFSEHIKRTIEWYRK